LLHHDGEVSETGRPDGGPGNGRLAQHAVLAKLAWGLVSEPGDVRPENEDFAGAYAPSTPDDSWDRGPLWVVADGMGGHAAGEVASRLAVTTAIESWATGNATSPAADLRGAIRAANTAICDVALTSGHRGMGTTVCALTLSGTDATVASVGDSRAYLVRGNECTQLTTDHSRVAEMLRMRLITPEQAATHPARSLLTRSLGAGLVVQVDITRRAVELHDCFVLCSDGLWDVVSRTDIADVCAAVGTDSVPTAGDAARALVGLALKRDTPDNATAVVVRVTSERPIPGSGGRRSLFRRGRARS